MDFKVTSYELGPKGLIPIDIAANSIKNNLKPGAVLHWGGNMAWAAQDYAVISRHEGSYGVHYDLIALEGYGNQRIEAFSVKSETDPAVWHGQHFFLTEQVLTPDELLDLIEKNKAKKLADEATKNAAASKFSRDVESIKAAHPELKQGQGCVIAAANIRKELKAAFPSVKFSVTSKSYSGGNNINIGWTDGPTTAQVKAITGKYSGGDFDGMTDSYTHSTTPWTETFGSSKYVFENRTTSPAMVERALKAAGWAGDARITVRVYGESACVQSEDRSLEYHAAKAVSEYDATKEAR
jgi:hypothetical protein